MKCHSFSYYTCKITYIILASNKKNSQMIKCKFKHADFNKQ